MHIHSGTEAPQLARKMATECPADAREQASRALGKIFDQALRPLGLQVSQLPLLCAAAMAGEAGASIGALARGIVLDPTTLTRNIRPLEKAGLLRVARSPQDKRTRMVFLTRSGERMIESVFPAWQRALGEANAAFGERRIGEVRTQLGRIVAMVDGFVGPDEAERTT